MGWSRTNWCAISQSTTPAGPTPSSAPSTAILIKVFISDKEFNSQVAHSFPALRVYAAVAVTMLEAPVKEQDLVSVAGTPGRSAPCKGGHQAWFPSPRRPLGQADGAFHVMQLLGLGEGCSTAGPRQGWQFCLSPSFVLDLECSCQEILHFYNAAGFQ